MNWKSLVERVRAVVDGVDWSLARALQFATASVLTMYVTGFLSVFGVNAPWGWWKFLFIVAAIGLCAYVVACAILIVFAIVGLVLGYGLESTPEIPPVHGDMHEANDDELRDKGMMR